MANKLSDSETDLRREKILLAARWCFLNFGFSKTSLDDIAKRADISRTLLYRTFKDKQEILVAVFGHWLVSRHPAAREAVAGRGSAFARLMEVCRLLVIEPWSDMVGAPMAREFHEACDRIDPEVSEGHRRLVLECVGEILGDAAAAEVFVLALDGLLADSPPVAALEERTRLLASRFAKPPRSPNS